MVVEEYPYDNNENLVRHYSDAGFTIIQNETGEEYGEAIDLYPCKYTYSESETPIEAESEEGA